MCGVRSSRFYGFGFAFTWLLPVLEFFFHTDETHHEDGLFPTARDENIELIESPNENVEPYREFTLRWEKVTLLGFFNEKRELPRYNIYCMPQQNEVTKPEPLYEKREPYQDYTPQWKATKPDELQFLFFEDQELREISPRGTIGDTNKRLCNSSPITECATKRKL